ncbi:MAG: hemin ABC transporter substrate-binding protein [Deltaproteobacteria bacterium]|nr:hemin ABC transporter substrate-binding protein [Deltaproteobacteria bacterium]
MNTPRPLRPLARVTSPPHVALCGALVVALLATPARSAQRLVTAGGDITEIVFALGAGDRVVAADTSSVYPATAAALPKVGYQRQLPAEGILAMAPDLVIVSDEAGPPAALAQLRDAGVRVEVIAADDSPDGASAKVRHVAALLDRNAAGETLIADMQAGLAQARADRAADSSAPRVLFVYARGAGTLMIAGRNTPADAMIGLAGGRNALADVEGFKPLTAEAVVAAQPDAVLMLARGVESLGGADAIWAQPGLAETPAGTRRRLIVMDDLYLLGFGPRLGDAARDLGRQLHPEISATR